MRILFYVVMPYESISVNTELQIKTITRSGNLQRLYRKYELLEFQRLYKVRIKASF